MAAPTIILQVYDEKFINLNKEVLLSNQFEVLRFVQIDLTGVIKFFFHLYNFQTV